MTREQAMTRVIQGYDDLKRAEDNAIAENATVTDYIFKCDRIRKLNRELNKRLNMLQMILNSELQLEQEFEMDKELSE